MEIQKCLEDTYNQLLIQRDIIENGGNYMEREGELKNILAVLNLVE